MAGSNPYRLSKVENERIFREEILPEKLKNIGSNLHPIEHPTLVIIGGQQKPHDGRRQTRILALTRPQHLDPQNITPQDPRGQKSVYRLA